MFEKLKTEKGAVHIIEATIVFPIMFLIIFMMITMGNAYLQKCRIESAVVQMAYYGAAQCADPIVKLVSEGKEPPKASNEHEVLPYRYLLRGKNEMGKIETSVQNQLRKNIEALGTGGFFGMEPKISSLKAKFNNKFVYSTFSVEVGYKVEIPVKLIGMEDFLSIKFSSRIDVPVSDTPEFVRNIAMLEDWIESNEQAGNFLTKVDEILSKVAPFIN